MNESVSGGRSVCASSLMRLLRSLRNGRLSSWMSGPSKRILLRRRRVCARLPSLREMGDRRQQHLRVRVGRLPEDLHGGAHLDDATAAHDQRRVGDVVAEREVVRDEEDPDALLLQVSEQVEDVDPGRRVEHADDLVGDEELEVEQQRAGDHQALQLSAAELVRVLAEHVRRLERDRLERLPQLRLPVGRAQPGKVARRGSCRARDRPCRRGCTS